MNRMTRKEIQEMINMYSSGNYTYKDLDLYFDRGLGTCRGLLQRRGYKAKSISEINRKYALNENFFDIINTEHKAYFLGLLYADGCNYPEATRIIINLQEGDKDILDKLKESLGYKRPLYYKISNTSSKNQYSLSISSKKISDSLNKIGMVKSKSLVLKYPDIPDHLNRHFIRGYFDGDGSLVKHKTKKDYKWNIIGTESFCRSVQEILVKELFLNFTKLEKRNKVYYLYYKGGKQVKKICDWMYFESTVYLDRKYMKYKTIYNGSN